MDFDRRERKIYGAYYTPIRIFWDYILPEIKDALWDHLWVDLFCGTGNLILPILIEVEPEDRIDFFKEHILCFDIMPEMVELAIKNAMKLGIPEDVARENIRVRDTLRDYPKELLDGDYPPFHITNPPYMYIGYIKKNRGARVWLKYFKGENEGFQDLYQLALMNDLRHNIERMVYIIPTNFLYGSSVSNKIREEFLFYYNIKKAIIFERRIFEHTGQHVAILFFERKKVPKHESQEFPLFKIKDRARRNGGKTIRIVPTNHYRTGTEFDSFVEENRSQRPLKVKYYLFIDEIIKNPGEYRIEAIDANMYRPGKGYLKREFMVNRELYLKIKSNVLFAKTIDGTREGDNAGIYIVRDSFDADCIVVTKTPYRTHPIQIFIEPTLNLEDQVLLKEYFNKLLNHFREVADSEFMTTYKYVDKEVTRKYLGLTQIRKLIETFPILELNSDGIKELREAVEKGDPEEIISFIRKIRKNTSQGRTPQR
ncbi:MAG: N-6 DNA methylase [Candidatus Asgardarchaeia archaeon]